MLEQLCGGSAVATSPSVSGLAAAEGWSDDVEDTLLPPAESDLDCINAPS